VKLHVGRAKTPKMDFMFLVFAALFVFSAREIEDEKWGPSLNQPKHVQRAEFRFGYANLAEGTEVRFGALGKRDR
jgi:hypothetical protein